MFLGMRVGIPMQGAGGLWSPYSASLAALLAEASSSGLVLDFTRNIAFRAGTQSTITGVSGWTYTRSGTAFDLAGTTSFGANVPRRTSAGLLVEAGATNLLLQSQTFNTTWAADAVAVTADNHAAPDGTLTADRVLEDSTTALHRIRQDTLTISAGAQVTASVFVKNASGSRWLAIQINGATGAAVVHFNPVTGAFGVAGVTAYTGTVASAVSLANGWWRFILTTTTVTDTAINVRLQFKEGDGTAGSYAGDGASGFFLWGAQLETGATASSYIPTTTTSASRGADAASVTGLTFSGAHSVIALVGVNSAPVGGDGVLQLDDGTNNNRSLIYAVSANSRIFASSGGVTQADQNIGLWSSSGGRIAARVNTNDVRGALNGTLGTADTVATLPAGTLSRVQLGVEPGGSAYLRGLLQLVAILPRALSDTELQNATA